MKQFQTAPPVVKTSYECRLLYLLLQLAATNIFFRRITRMASVTHEIYQCFY
jgi:hypothetical protein